MPITAITRDYSNRTSYLGFGRYMATSRPLTGNDPVLSANLACGGPTFWISLSAVSNQQTASLRTVHIDRKCQMTVSGLLDFPAHCRQSEQPGAAEVMAWLKTRPEGPPGVRKR
jgi:hypothetical protein